MTDASQQVQAVLMYDGSCKLCTAQAENLARLSRGHVRAEALQTAVARFPQVSREEALREMKLVTSGKVYGGAEAFVQLIQLGYPVWGKLLYPYYLPGIRQLSDWLYDYIARNRYRLFGTVPEDACDDGACSLHYNLPEQQCQKSD
jgi:predicted DCC family thiol-disulfide oxidoreductase YuxK